MRLACVPTVFVRFRVVQEKDQEAFRRRYFWAYDTTPDGEGVNATSTKLLILPNGKMMSVERREQMDAACADRPKIGDDRPNQVRHRGLERRTTRGARCDIQQQLLEVPTNTTNISCLEAAFSMKGTGCVGTAVVRC